MTTATRTTAPPTERPCTRSSGKHLYFGSMVCAECGYARLTTPEVLIDPEAFRDGERLAYDRVLAFLASQQEQGDLATRGRDQGRGAAHAVRDLAAYVTALRDDLG